ncbi:sensor histidine kinase [Hoeflea prorocentri]|uniref:histidine kinase n=1 Tax=Hoeflea prorocentri TaxID=1922333 RepID=A0A9X3UHM0_9HYPH|nr:ATP-binding protein [Hoeflea prorocentri]MCY6381497.1 ATP-binding protein [Hoeflea prorocentri]MDA5399297.1 ATP-binding protein [Hoeflea prorocentri]
MSRFGTLLRTTAVRMSALYLGLFSICAVALVFYVTDLTSSLLTQQTRQIVQDELKVLGNFYNRGGVSMLIGHMDRRSREPGANLYIIASTNGRILAGNVESLEAGVLDIEGWTESPFTYRRFYQPEGTPGHAALAQVIFLPNGMRVLVGRDLGEPTRFRTMVRSSLAMALGIMMIGALVIWFVIGRGALQRIDRVSQASRKIMAGDLSQRLPVSGSRDEFDRLSEALNAMLGRIEKLNEGLRQVSDNIAHDLKTPLTRLRNRAEAALAGDRDTEAYREAMQEMIEESDQLIRTFNALLMISRVEAGAAVAEMSEVDLTQIAHDVAELYEPVAEEAGVALSTRIDDGVKVTGNRELIGQALTNLIDNAIKYSADGEGTPRIQVRLDAAGSGVVLSVADSGPGIPETMRTNVVKRFVRLDESRSIPGTGLGLSLVDAIMDLHGGRLELVNCCENEQCGLCARMVFDMRS